MIRLAVSPLLILLGMALIAHSLAMAWVDWSACFDNATKQTSPYRDYLTSLFSTPSMAVPVLGAPFLPFLFMAMFVRAPERLFWQWIGIGITNLALLLMLSGIAHPCPDEDSVAEYGLPELVPILFGGVLGFVVCLAVTWIGAIRLSRREHP